MGTPSENRLCIESKSKNAHTGEIKTGLPCSMPGAATLDARSGVYWRHFPCRDVATGLLDCGHGEVDGAE